MLVEAVVAVLSVFVTSAFSKCSRRAWLLLRGTEQIRGQ